MRHKSTKRSQKRASTQQMHHLRRSRCELTDVGNRFAEQSEERLHSTGSNTPRSDCETAVTVRTSHPHSVTRMHAFSCCSL